MRIAMTLLLVILSPLFGGSLLAQQPAKPPVKVEFKTDADLIQGKWIAVRSWEYGTEVALPRHLRAVFLAKECKFAGVEGATIFQYKLDFWKNPKRLDLRMALAELDVPTIYELNGDTLKIAKSDSGVPKDFKPGKNVVVTIYQRAEKVLAEQGSAPAKELSPEETTALNSLRKALARFRQLLEQAKYEEFFQEFGEPSEIKRVTSSPTALEEFQRHYKDHGPILAKFLKIMETEVPTFSFDRTKAYFDTRLVHVEGLHAQSQLRLECVDGKWRSRDR